MVGEIKSEGNCGLHGRYELGRLLGMGTFAKVYLAKNIKTGHKVAMKIVLKEKVIRVGVAQHVNREISVMKKVTQHPNIVQLYELMATRSKIYLAMEVVRGGELFSKVQRSSRLREDAARKYFCQLISAVDFCHSRGVYHCDLKPENLLLDDKGNLKVADFGLSAFSEHVRSDGLLHTTCGTPAYVAPEVLLRRGYDGSISGPVVSSSTFSSPDSCPLPTSTDRSCARKSSAATSGARRRSDAANHQNARSQSRYANHHRQIGRELLVQEGLNAK